jgi:hypothetical protein
MAMARRSIVSEISMAAAIVAGAVARGEDAAKVKNPWAWGERTTAANVEVSKAENDARFREYIEARKAGRIK